MKTSKSLRKEIMDRITKASSVNFTSNTYDNFLSTGLIDSNNKPTEKLIFLSFKELENEINNFFNNMNIYYSSNNNFKIEYFKKPEKKPISQFKKSIKKEKTNFQKKFIHVYEIIRDNFGDKLQNENEISICPYCEKNYINLVYANDKTLKPDLDHFYPQGLYPFLACSIENLIPSCQMCNSRLKGEKDFFKYKHTNPLLYKLFDDIKFSYDAKGIFIQNFNSLNKKKEQENYLDTFKIQEVYASHNEILEDIQTKYKMYNKSKQKGLIKSCPSLTHNEILEMVFYEYINENKKHPFRKLKKDLYEKVTKYKK